MNRPVKLTSRPQQALQSYLEDLLLDLPEDVPPPVEAQPPVVEQAQPEVMESAEAMDEFQAAVLEEQARSYRDRGHITPPAEQVVPPTGA